MSKLALPPPSPHSSRTTHYAMFKRHPHGSGFLTRGCHARASLDFCTFCFHNLHRETKNQDYFHPKTEDKTAKKCPTLPQKRRRFSQKRGSFLKKRGRFSRKCRTFFLKYSETLPTQPRHFVLSATKSRERVPSP